MADEFVDFYEALNLPLEADRADVRKRINELYLEAQRNLDHRTFQTRIKYQEMFEVVLPRARYILLDEGRRDEYDRLVRAFRAPATPAPQAPLKPSFGPGDASSFRLAEVEEASGKAPPIEALPKTGIDVQQMAVQRDEMWAKWKSGLESAIARDEAEKPVKPVADKPAPATTSRPAPASTPREAEATARKTRQNASAISFNFDSGNNSGDDEESARAAAFELERQKTERKRAVMKEILDNVGMKGALMGGFGAALPSGTLLLFLMGRFYPQGAAPTIPLPSALAWFLGIAVVAGTTFVAANEFSKSMRKQASAELSALPLEALLRRMGRTY